MIGPVKKPQDFGFKDGDSHLIVNDIDETLTAYDHSGAKLFSLPALARGQHSETDYRSSGSDTPPGIYKLGTVYNDVAAIGEKPPTYCNDDMLAYGWLSFDMVSLDGNEERAGRAGIMLHGGGSACGWPGAWEPKQQLWPTMGCVRTWNIELRDRILPLTKKGTVFVSVYQES